MEEEQMIAPSAQVVDFALPARYKKEKFSSKGYVDQRPLHPP